MTSAPTVRHSASCRCADCAAATTPANVVPIRPIKGPRAMGEKLANAQPPTHTIIGPARVLYMDQDTEHLRGRRVTVKAHITAHETAHVYGRLEDGRPAWIPAQHLRPFTPEPESAQP